jgi:hypothetical protein
MKGSHDCNRKIFTGCLPIKGKIFVSPAQRYPENDLSQFILQSVYWGALRKAKLAEPGRHIAKG